MSVPISLGHHVRDKASGFTGYVIGRIEWISGRVTIIVQPGRIEGEPPAPVEMFDEEQLEIVWAESWIVPPTTA